MHGCSSVLSLLLFSTGGNCTQPGERLPRTPCLPGRLFLVMPPCAWNCSWKEPTYQVNGVVSLFCFAWTSLKKETELSVPYFVSPSDTGVSCGGKWVIRSPWQSSCVEKRNCLFVSSPRPGRQASCSPGLLWTCSPPFLWDRVRGEDAVSKL